MEEEKLKKQIGTNISVCRKQHGMTQAALAEKLNYSDKAVSKWERGESAPDVLTLMQLAELFDTSVDELLKDPNALPEKTGAVERVMGMAVEKTLKRKADKRIILGLSAVLVWFVALLAMVLLYYLRVPHCWSPFVYAIPVNAIVLLSLRCAWRDYRRNRELISMIVWGTLLSVFMTLAFFDIWIWGLFLLGIPGQVAVLLWCRLYRKVPKEEKHG